MYVLGFLTFLLVVAAQPQPQWAATVQQPTPAGNLAAQQPERALQDVVVMLQTLKTPDGAASAATNAANAAANAAEVAVIAAKTAANAAVSANTAANEVASAHAAAGAVARSKASATARASVKIGANVAASASANVASNGDATVSVSAAPFAMVPASSAWSTSQWYIMQASQLIAGLTFAMIVKAFCVAGNMLVQVSPFPQVRRWESRGCTGEADAAPYVSIAFGGCQWCFYGAFAWIVTSRSGFLILVHANCLGAILGTYYVRTFYRNCRNEVFLASLQKYLSAVSALALLQVCAMSVLPAERALFLTGLISSFCSFVGATSVLVTVPTVLRTKDSRSIPGPFAVANLCSALVWSLCGYLLDDPLVMVPNLFACACSATSLGLKVIYPSELFPSGEDKLALVEEGIETPGKKGSLTGKRVLDVPTEFTPIKSRMSEKSVFAFLEGQCQKVLMPVAVVDDAGDGTDGTGGTC